MAKYKVKSLTMTFGGNTYKARTIPAGQQQSSEPVDVTTLDDTELRYIPGALVSHKEFEAVVQGVTEQPAINTTGDVVLSITYNDGTTDTSKTVTIPNCILFDVDAPSGDATGDRAANWTFHFRPGGGEAASNSGSGSGEAASNSGSGGGEAASNSGSGSGEAASNSGSSSGSNT